MASTPPKRSPRTGAGAGAPLFTSLRVIVLALLVLLLAHTVLAGLRLSHTAEAALQGPQPTAALIDDAFITFAPLALGLCLAIVLFRQSRKAEADQDHRSESERRFRSAVEAAHCGIWEWRIRDDMVDLSEVTGFMFGWGGGGLATGAEVLARIAPEDRERVRKALIDAAEHGAFDVTFRVPSASGDAWIDARGQGIGERDDLGYAAIMGVALDVTEEHVAQARGLAAEARLNDAIEAVSEAFVLWDRHDRLVMCNHNFVEFFSLDPRLLKPGASRSTVMHVAEVAIRGERPAPDVRAGIREAEMVDGRWLQISERKTADGGTVMTAADITVVKRQEEASRRNEIALQQAVVRLEQNGGQLAELAAKYEQEKIRAQQANAAKSEFLANMSHELRTPLNAINGFSEMMAREMLGPLGHPRYVEYASDIHASGHHLLALINDILDMAKIEAGKQSLKLEDVNLAGLIDDAMRLMGPRATEGDLTLSSDIPPLPLMQIDHRAVTQVVLNLLSNAIKFTPRGGRVKIRARQVNYRVMVSVMDTGIGISKEDLARLAQPFQQVESQLAKTQQGTGLGLALSKSLIELHEGRFEIASEPGRGTTVSFILPIRQRPTRELQGGRLDIEPGDYAPSRSHG
jgi:two-component system, cell cycle sensor histidine kinase PleC